MMSDSSRQGWPLFGWANRSEGCAIWPGAGAGEERPTLVEVTPGRRGPVGVSGYADPAGA